MRVALYPDRDAIRKAQKLTTCGGTMRPLRQGSGLLYAALVIAAIAVILLSVIGIAIMSDIVPGMPTAE